MADILRTTTSIAPTHPRNSEIFDGIAGETIAAGQQVYLASTGKWMVGDTNAAGKQQVRGLALNAATTGKPGLSVLKRGPVAGFSTNMPAYDALVYASDTAGETATAAGTVSSPCGRVMAIPDGGTPTKVIYFDFNWISVFA